MLLFNGFLYFHANIFCVCVYCQSLTYIKNPKTPVKRVRKTLSFVHTADINEIKKVRSYITCSDRDSIRKKINDFYHE